MNNYSHKIVGFAIHVLVWTGLWSMPFVIGLFTNSPPPPFVAGTLITPLQLMGMFYLNYLYLINKLLFHRRNVLFIVINIVCIAAFTVSGMAVRELTLPEPLPVPFRDFARPAVNFHLIMNIAMQILVVGLSVAIRMTGKWYEVRQQVHELERTNTKAELQQLKSQLNPHFLFNSLNNIYALIAFNPEKAQLSLHSLCDMLRYQLYEASRETIPLYKEIEFVRSYCDLMRLRLSKNVTLDLDLPTEPNHVVIAPLLFVSIVENAFKHGISQSEKSRIDIMISVCGDRVECVVRNSYFPKKDNDRSGSGIGIENLHRRLELLYPGSYSFTAQKTGEEFVARLTLNL